MNKNVAAVVDVFEDVANAAADLSAAETTSTTVAVQYVISEFNRVGKTLPAGLIAPITEVASGAARDFNPFHSFTAKGMDERHALAGTTAAAAQAGQQIGELIVNKLRRTGVL